MSYGYQRASNVNVPGLWVVIFTATLSAILVGTFIICVCARVYAGYLVTGRVGA